ncbi:asparaginase [soil metagenome]
MVNKQVPAVRRIIVLGTGGTIAGRSGARGDNIGYTAAQVGVAELLGDIDLPADITVHAEQVAQIDSKDMDVVTWQRLARRCMHWLAQSDVTGIVITHGTDTLEETAFFLHLALRPHKPVVITCAMRPASALSPDGPQNVRDAIAVASTPGAQGVVAVCAGVVHSAIDVQKVHTYRLDAFNSGDAGPIGYVEEGDVRQLREWPAGGTSGHTLPSAPGAIALDPADWPRVEILMSHAGAGAGLVDALISERRLGKPDAARGLVLAATGNGTLHHTLEAAAMRAQSAGMVVVRATRCAQGRILPKSGEALRDAGALTPVKARVALMLELMGLLTLDANASGMSKDED